MSCLIVYKSKTGFSKKYAERLAQTLGAAALDAGKVKKNDIENAECIVWCAGVYASRVRGVGKLRQLAAKYEGKRFFVLAVGATRDENGFYREELERANLPGGRVKLFYARGGIDEEKIGAFDRWVIKMIRKTLSEKAEKTEEEKNLLSSFYDEEFVLDEIAIYDVKKAIA